MLRPGSCFATMFKHRKHTEYPAFIKYPKLILLFSIFTFQIFMNVGRISGERMSGKFVILSLPDIIEGQGGGREDPAGGGAHTAALVVATCRHIVHRTEDKVITSLPT